MADEQGAPNIWSLAVTGISTLGVIFVAWLHGGGTRDLTARERDNAASANINRTNEAIIAGLRAECERKDRQVLRAQTEADDWQAAARGMDEIARDQWHVLANAVQGGSAPKTMPERVPKLESFFNAQPPAT